jgi:MFS family permease
MAGGLLIVAGTIALLGLVNGGTDLWLVRLDMLVLGYGMSHVFIPAQAASFATISPSQTGRASSIFNAGRQLGGAVGVAVLTTVLAAAGPTHVVAGHTVANLSAYHVAFLAATGVAVLAAFVALRVRDRDAVSTMVARRHGPHSRPEPAVTAEVA